MQPGKSFWFCKPRLKKLQWRKIPSSVPAKLIKEAQDCTATWALTLWLRTGSECREWKWTYLAPTWRVKWVGTLYFMYLLSPCQHSNMKKKNLHWQCIDISHFQVTPFTAPGRGQIISKEVKKWFYNKNNNHHCVLRTLLAPFSFSEVCVFNDNKVFKYAPFWRQERTKEFS